MTLQMGWVDLRTAVDAINLNLNLETMTEDEQQCVGELMEALRSNLDTAKERELLEFFADSARALYPQK